MAELHPGPLRHVLGREEQIISKQLGGDSEFMEKVGKYFGGTMMEARRIFEPLAGEGGESQPEDSSDDA